jgi:uncharacterized protein (TIRG00374 family)
VKNRAALVAQILVSIGLLTWLFHGLDRHALATLLLSLPIWFFAASLAVVLAGQVLYAWRWGRLLNASGIPLPNREILRHYFVAVFANNFMPGTIGGDVVKIYYVGREHGYRGVTASVIVDRVLGIGVLAAAGAVVGWLRPGIGPRFVAARLALTLVTGVAAVLLGVAMSGTGGLVRWIRPLGPRAVDMAGRLQRLRHSMAASLSRPIVFAQAAAVVVIYFIGLTLVYQWFIELNALPAPAFGALFLAVTAVAVLSNIPIAVNGLGVREQLHAWLLAPLGIPTEIAVAISLLLYGHLLVGSLFGLMGWLRAPGIPDDIAEQVGM